MVAHPGVGGDGAGGEPDETGGAAEHSVVLAIAMPGHVAAWNTVWKKNNRRDLCATGDR